MPPDFKEMSIKARKEYEDKIAAEEAEVKLEAEQRERQIDSAIELLEKTALPIINEARAAFMEDGVGIEVIDNFDMAKNTRLQPSITIRCVRLKTRPDGYQFQGRRVFLDCDGEKLTATASSDRYSDRPRQYVAGGQSKSDAESVTKAAIERALTGYYSDIKDDRHILD